eukprot:TRINITY_DN3528_c0_g1_i10.p1 TRINITY_DN3528_c0_g1~~TRINITY_DN3528_c0_g1_i10.p1  ORF type:complete len:104 (-),score=5.23 TRINITY_DN3528_c0_g1_i10:309-620(-)
MNPSTIPNLWTYQGPEIPRTNEQFPYTQDSLRQSFPPVQLQLPVPTEIHQIPNLSNRLILDPNNKGFSMALRMGWNPGKGLGREENGTPLDMFQHVKIKICRH